MNVLLLSPDFPPNYRLFAQRLVEAGAQVFALGEADFYELPETLRRTLRWYVRCELASTAALDAAVDHLHGEVLVPQGWGAIQLVESHNEQWLRAEAHLNQRLGLAGICPDDLPRLKQKSVQKRIFESLGLPVARGGLVHTLPEARQWARQLGYPLILKPDQGVGAQGVARVDDDTQLEARAAWLGAGYVVEQFIDARMVTYDGLTDLDGAVVFESSMEYACGVLENVQGQDTQFHVRRVLPPELAALGRRVVAALGLRRKFFHMELFELADGRYLPVELNARPPGGAILDMMNYSVDGDLYRAWADLACGRAPALPTARRHAVGFAGRKQRRYRHSHDEILRRAGPALVEWGDNPPLFHAGMGRTRYLVRSPEVDEVRALGAFILEAEDGT
jgi:biotin carboxylase